MERGKKTITSKFIRAWKVFRIRERISYHGRQSSIYRYISNQDKVYDIEGMHIDKNWRDKKKMEHYAGCYQRASDRMKKILNSYDDTTI